MTRIFTFSLFVALSSCVASSAMAPVEANDNDVMRVQGDWAGEVEGTELSGDVAFNLRLGRRTAVARATLTGQSGSKDIAFEALRIDGNSFRAVSKPYVDEKCQCQVKTEFSGIVRGDVISGSVTHVSGARVESGSWTAKRN